MKTYFVAVRWSDDTTLLSDATDFHADQTLRGRVAAQRNLRAALFECPPVAEQPNGTVEPAPTDWAPLYGLYRLRADLALLIEIFTECILWDTMKIQ